MMINKMEVQAQEEDDDWLNQNKELQGNIFQKISINFTNEIIQRNIDKEMENPIHKRPIEEYDIEENNGQSNEPEMKQKEKAQFVKQQALYNPLEDDENEKWVKKLRNRQKRPLNCPACFNQIAYEYKIKESGQKNMIYECREVFSCSVIETKIMRSLNAKEKMNWQGVVSETAEQNLRLREQQINIKILVQCDCSYQLGYYDINNQNYVILNAL